MDLGTYIATNRNKRPNANVAERWQTRVVPRGLQTMGEAGAHEYLNQYGRGIAAPKCIMFAIQATNEGHPLMAMGFWKKAYELETGLFPGNVLPVSVVGNPQVARPAVPALPTSQFLPSNLQPGKLVTMQPDDAQAPRAHYLSSDEYWGQPKRDGNKVVIFAAPDGVWYQSRSMKLRASASYDMDTALLKLAKQKAGAFILEGELYYLDCTNGEHRTGAQAATVNMEAGRSSLPATRYMPFYAIYRPDRDLRDATHAIRVLEGNAIANELHDLSPIFVVPVTFRTTEEKTAMARLQFAEGREGEVWTRANAVYHAGKDKSDDVVRTKYLTEFNARIVSLTATTAQGRLFGAIEIADPVTGKPLGNVGTGFDLEAQKKIQKMHIANPGKVIIPVISQGWTENGIAFHARLSEDFN